MFFYYALHSTWNQLRRFMRTWAFFLLMAILALGGVVRYGIVWYYRRLQAANDVLPESFMEFFEVNGLTALNALELAVGLILLGILLIQLIGAERSVSRLFMQADVNILFASPRSPQAVLAFRVVTTLGLAIAAAVYMALQIPSYMGRYGLSLYGAGSILIAWCLTLAFSMLLKILIFELGSRHAFLRRNLRWFLFALLALVGYLFYAAYTRTDERELLLTAQGFFNAPWTRFIPVWGWSKGVMMYALEGDAPLSLCLLSLSLSLIAVLTLTVSRLRADYYEETLSSAEEAALYREEVGSDNATLLVMAPRRAARDVAREGFNHGCGANVYFFKVLHHRFRTARFGFVTKTMLTYLFAAVAAGLFVRHFMDDPLPYMPVLLLTVMVFFRTIVSPVTEDIRKDTFLLQSEPIWAKLGFSLLGGSCNCALDAALPLMAGSVAAGFPPLMGLMYLPVLVTADFFATSSGAFTDVSIPASIGISLKQVAQVLLLYFGLIFDGVVLAYGLNVKHSTAGFVLVAVLNLLFGAAFLGLTGVWLYPCRGRPTRSKDDITDDAGARRRYTRMGLALTGMYLAVYASQYLLSGRADAMMATYLPIYAIGFPVFLLLMGKGGERPERRALGLRGFLPLIPVCFFVMYSGNIVGTLLQGLVSWLMPFSLFPQMAEPSTEHLALQATFAAFASPVMEEIVFRRCLIDRLRPYGERAALLTSALAFGLFHGTVNQLCYGFLLGLVFGYVYLKTGRLRYSILLHTVINSLTTLVLPALLMLASQSARGMNPRQVQIAAVIRDPGVLALLIFIALLLILSLFGAVLFAFGVREREISPNGARMRTVFSSWGLLLFVAIAVAALL